MTAEREQYRGADLAGADFSGRDIRGVDFSLASLAKSSFRGARLGVRPLVGAALLMGAVVVSIGAGLIIGWSVDGTIGRFSSDEWDQVSEGISISLVLVVFLAVTVWKGIDKAYVATLVLYAALVALNLAANALWETVEWDELARATLTVIFLSLAIGAGVLGRVIGGYFGAWAIGLVAVLGGLASGRLNGGVAGMLIALCLVFVSKRALRGDPRDRRLLAGGRVLIRRLGTRFVGADLTEADFRGTSWRGADFRGAELSGVQWGESGPPAT